MKNARNLFTLSRFFLSLYAASTIASGGTSVSVKIQRDSIQCHSSLADSYLTLKEYLHSISSGESRQPPDGGRVRSEVVCAMKALRRRSVAYAYRNGSCLLIGEGESLDCRFASYGPIDQGLLNVSALEREFESFLSSMDPALVYESNNVGATTLKNPTTTATVTKTSENISSAAVTESTSAASATTPESSTTVIATVTESTSAASATTTTPESSTTAIATVTESATVTGKIDVTAKGYIEIAATGNVFATEHKKTLSASYPKELAIDQDTMTKYISTTLTLSKPWWMVDLKEVQDVKMIYILPYVECGLFCVDAIHLMFYAGDSFVEDGNFESYINVANYWGVYSSNMGYIGASVYTKAQYIAIVLNGEIGFDVLALAEVQVFVEP